MNFLLVLFLAVIEKLQHEKLGSGRAVLCSTEDGIAVYFAVRIKVKVRVVHKRGIWVFVKVRVGDTSDIKTLINPNGGLPVNQN